MKKKCIIEVDFCPDEFYSNKKNKEFFIELLFCNDNLFLYSRDLKATIGEARMIKWGTQERPK